MFGFIINFKNNIYFRSENSSTLHSEINGIMAKIGTTQNSTIQEVGSQPIIFLKFHDIKLVQSAYNHDRILNTGDRFGG